MAAKKKAKKAAKKTTKKKASKKKRAQSFNKELPAKVGSFLFLWVAIKVL